MQFIDFGYPPTMLAKSVQSLLFEAQEEDVPRMQTFTSRIQVPGKARQWELTYPLQAFSVD